jgi:hypothetical protein
MIGVHDSSRCAAVCSANKLRPWDRNCVILKSARLYAVLNGGVYRRTSTRDMQKIIDSFLLLLIPLLVTVPTQSASGADMHMVSHPIAHSIESSAAIKYYTTLPSRASLPNATQCATDVLKSDSIELVSTNSRYNATIPTRSQLNAIGFYDTPT